MRAILINLVLWLVPLSLTGQERQFGNILVPAG